MMYWMNKAFQVYLRLQMPRIKRFMNKPIKTQNQVLKGLIQKARYTAWGKEYDYSSIKTPKQFAAQVPIGDYETHKPYINKMMHGEADILWPGTICWYSKSSGTTNDKSKYIPVSPESIRKCHMKGPLDSISLVYQNFPETNVFSGKSLIMGGSYQTFEANPKTRMGDVSSIMIEHISPFLKKTFYTPSMDIALMPEFEAKIEQMAHQVIHENVTHIGGVPTWTIVLFRRILEITGKSNMLEIWPNFNLYFHGGVSFEPYKAQFQEFFPGDQVKYFEVFNASEGYFAVQSDKDSKDMALLLNNGIYFEFLPMEEWEKENPKAIPLSEVEIDKVYAMLISTNSGLWRYKNGDTVKFTSTKPYKIKITGRTKHFINAFGEEVMVANTDLALSMTCQQTDAKVSEYTVAPIYFAGTLVGKGGHEWLIEFNNEPTDLENFNRLLDLNLQSINSDYEAKRYKNLALEQLTIRPIPKGTFHNWLKSKGKYGGQHKVPRLANHRKYLDEILGFMDREEVAY